MNHFYAMNIKHLRTTFPTNIPIPDALAQLCEWEETNGYPISGGFELYADTHDSIALWFGASSVVDRFGVFGTGPDGSLYAIWHQDDGRQTIVHMGSEGQNNFVLASNFIAFLGLLAIGYEEIGFADLSQPPMEAPNLAFQHWVTENFEVIVPAIGAEIVDSACETPDDFQTWINDKVR